MVESSLRARMTHRAPKSVVREDELRAHAATIEARHLLLAAVHVTGDLSLLDEFAHTLPMTDSPLTRALHPKDPSADPPEVREALLDILCSALTQAEQPEYLHPDDPEVFKRLATVAMGAPVDDAQLPVCMEQGGFVPDRPVVPATTPPHEGFNLAIIGAGMAGIDAAVKASSRGVPYTVYEKAPDIGGIWWSQRYPGVAVDTPSLYYSLSFEIAPAWSKYYPLGEEYRRYLNRLVEKYELTSGIQCNSNVVRMEWLEAEQQWELTIRDTIDGSTRTARHAAVVTGAGQFSGPRYPDVTGRETFEGEQVHTTTWRDVDFEGKRVAVVGTGAAGVQVIGALAPASGHMTVFQRQPHWIQPNFLPNEGDVAASELWLRLHLPYYLHWSRFEMSYYSNVLSWKFVEVDDDWAKTHPHSISPLNDQFRQICLDYINATFGAGSELARKVTPEYPFFSKRPVRDPGDLKPGGYYWALLQPHVDLITDGIDSVVPTGIVTTDGTLHEVDVIVWATGMTTEFLCTTEAVGRDGVVLAELWGDYDARTYLGGTVPGFPNLFIGDGPNTGIGAGGGGHNFAVETTGHFIFECLQLMFERGAGAIEVTQEAHDRHNARIEEQMEKLVWMYDQTAHGYFRNASGRVIFQNPFPAHETWAMSRAPDESAFILHEPSVLEDFVA